MEGKDRVLAGDKRYFASVFACKHGIVHVNWINASIRFNPKMFVDFAMMVNDAYHRIGNIDEASDQGVEDEQLGID